MKSRKSQRSAFKTPACTAKQQRQCSGINWSAYISQWLIVHKSSGEIYSKQKFFSVTSRLLFCLMETEMLLHWHQKTPPLPFLLIPFRHPEYQWFEDWKSLSMKTFMLFSLISLVLIWAEDIQPDLRFFFFWSFMEKLSTKFFSMMERSLERLISVCFSQEKEKLITVLKLLDTIYVLSPPIPPWLPETVEPLLPISFVICRFLETLLCKGSSCCSYLKLFPLWYLFSSLHVV